MFRRDDGEYRLPDLATHANCYLHPVTGRFVPLPFSNYTASLPATYACMSLDCPPVNQQTADTRLKSSHLLVVALALAFTVTYQEEEPTS